MTKQHYIEMMIMMRQEPNPEDMPLDILDLDYESQMAVHILNILPDKIEGMNGLWLGKDFSGILDIMSLCGIEDFDQKKEVFDLMLIGISEYHEHYKQQRDANSMQKRGLA